MRIPFSVINRKIFGKNDSGLLEDCSSVTKNILHAYVHFRNSKKCGYSTSSNVTTLSNADLIGSWLVNSPNPTKPPPWT